MKPSKPGWFWYHEDPSGWEVLKVFTDADMGMMVKRIHGPTQSAIPISCLYGTWGDEVALPLGSFRKVS
jgi:hypothetical protein